MTVRHRYRANDLGLQERADLPKNFPVLWLIQPSASVPRWRIHDYTQGAGVRVSFFDEQALAAKALAAAASRFLFPLPI